MIPGVNLLSVALSVIQPQPIYWRQYKDRRQNALGNWINEFYPDALIRGSWQPMGANDAKEHGFDTAKEYFSLFTPHDIKEVARGASTDQIIVSGQLFDVVECIDWYAQDGWKHLICCAISGNRGLIVNEI